MKKKLQLILCLFLLWGAGHVSAQQNLTYNHYYLNPFLYNPSFIAQSGYSELHLNYRHQWTGFEGAPKTATMNLQLPLNYKSGFAITGFQDQAGQIKTTTGLASFSYQVFLGRRIIDLHKIGFGISAGYTSSRISIDETSDHFDPVSGNKTSSLDGQFGMHYQYNKFKFGFAIPRLFQNNVAAEERFTHRGITQIKNTITSVSYDFELSPFISLEPILTYRTSEGRKAQYEALASLKFLGTGWVGAAYRQDYGMFAFLGLDLKERLKVGYAYEFATDQSDRIGTGSHEVQLVVRIGKKHFGRPQLGGKSATATSGYASKQTNNEVVSDDELENEDVEEDEYQDQVIVTAEENDAPVQNMDPAGFARTVRAEQNEDLSSSENQSDQVIKSGDAPVKLNGSGLAPGHYVVVGVFAHKNNALDYVETLKRAGYPASVAFDTAKNRYIVHMRNASTIEEAREQRDEYRKMSRYSFRDTWVLSVE